jgi:glucosamine--fructose-6-phosphate aminotransferase (isomerizing)
MCGIISYIGKESGFSKVINGLRMIQNRGYDSSGIGCMVSTKSKEETTHSIKVSKYARGNCAAPIDRLEERSSIYSSSSNIISHTRWATHGGNTDENAHPHVDFKNMFAVVHNGVIENYIDVRNSILSSCHSASFKSETDTEVIVNQISLCYTSLLETRTTNSKGDLIVMAIENALSFFQGTWAIVVICSETPDVMYVARKESPLLIGYSKNYLMVASEHSAFHKSVDTYRCLPENTVCILRKTDTPRTNLTYECYPFDTPLFDVSHHHTPLELSCDAVSPHPYEHWMLKEINSQEQCVDRLVTSHVSRSGKISLPLSKGIGDDMLQIDHLFILGCGTSYYAGLYSTRILQKIGGFKSVQVINPYNFESFMIPKTGKTGLLLLSQSGETKDLMNCLTIAKKHDLYTIGIVNTVGSTISREANSTLYIGVGKEVAVASTKSFTSQITMVYILTAWYSQERGVHHDERKSMVDDLCLLPKCISNTILETESACKQVASDIHDKQTVFMLGKGGSESIAMEGCLKWKEIGYIHASGYNSSALRHGPFALLTPETPVVLLNPSNCYHGKNNIIALEVASRYSPVIGISDVPLDTSLYSNQISIRKNNSFSDLLSVLPLQLISYYIAIEKGHSPDFPRNLAKTITVD